MKKWKRATGNEIMKKQDSVEMCISRRTFRVSLTVNENKYRRSVEISKINQHNHKEKIIEIYAAIKRRKQDGRFPDQCYHMKKSVSWNEKRLNEHIPKCMGANRQIFKVYTRIKYIHHHPPHPLHCCPHPNKNKGCPG